MKKKVIIFSHYVDNDNNYLQYLEKNSIKNDDAGRKKLLF